MLSVTLQLVKWDLARSHGHGPGAEIAFAASSHVLFRWDIKQNPTPISRHITNKCTRSCHQ